jgi:pimeloyl-ACP methyl ester carboxylesterase
VKSTFAFVIAFVVPFAGAISADDAGKRETFDSNGVKIHYTVEGKGEPVVLIHGLYSSADINWRLPGTIKALAARYQVIALDVRGHGRSDKQGEISTAKPSNQVGWAVPTSGHFRRSTYCISRWAQQSYRCGGPASD